MKKQIGKNNKRKFAITQVILLLISIFAFSYILGSSFPVVSAQNNGSDFTGGPLKQQTPSTQTQNQQPTQSPFIYGFVIPNIVSEGLSKVHNFLFTPDQQTRDILSKAYELGIGVDKVNIDKAKELLNEGKSIEEAINGAIVTGEEGGGAAGELGFLAGVKSVLSSAAYAAAAYVAVKWVASSFGLQPGPAKALASGAATGVFTGTFLTSKLGESILAALGVPGIGWIVAGVVAIFVTLFTWKDEKTDTVIFTCSLWQPQPGGNSCDKCNDGPFSCSEYQCSSLGVSCQIVNKGTKDQKCIWVDRNDVDPPIMTPWQEALKAGYSYVNNNVVSPPNRGVFVKYDGSGSGCVPPYTPFSFGVKVNKESKCRADVVRESNFSKMRIPLSGERYLEEHEISLGFPSMKDLEAENITQIGESGRDHKLYVKCMSGNGIVTNAHLEFSYCIDDAPDLNPPRVIETSILNGAPVRFGVGSLNNFILSIDKPGQCKWSTLDKTYEDMENTMTCSTNVRQANAKMLYDCKTNLTGIKDRVENNFYFRCKGTYNEKVSKESFKFTVFGTQPLVIDKVGPNGTIKDSTDPVKVILTATTSAGYENGKAICQSSTGKEGDYITFYNTNSYNHSQELRLSEGTYNYSVKCFDLGGNTDIKIANFTVEIDKKAPAIVRAFHEGNYLKIITNEKAECVYDTQDAIDCNYIFDDGISMTTLDDKEHFTDWNTLLNFYIKCRDEYGNQPAPNKCSIVARPFIL